MITRHTSGTGTHAFDCPCKRCVSSRDATQLGSARIVDTYNTPLTGEHVIDRPEVVRVFR